MNPLIRLHRSLALWCLVVLAGCGPTGGGTGTGESVFGPSDFGARPASVCLASIASQLICPPAGTASGDAPQQGTAPVYYLGTSASGTYTLTLQGNRVELLSRCDATHFDGEWGQLPSGEGRAFGGFTGREGGLVQPAQMQVQALGGGADGLQLLVLDAGGRSLFGPLPLLRVPALPTAAPVCR